MRANPDLQGIPAAKKMLTNEMLADVLIQGFSRPPAD